MTTRSFQHDIAALLGSRRKTERTTAVPTALRNHDNHIADRIRAAAATSDTFTADGAASALGTTPHMIDRALRRQLASFEPRGVVVLDTSAAACYVTTQEA